MRVLLRRNERQRLWNALLPCPIHRLLLRLPNPLPTPSSYASPCFAIAHSIQHSATASPFRGCAYLCRYRRVEPNLLELS